MSQREELIDILESSHAKILSLLNEVDIQREIYPLWTVREIMAHLAGWDDLVIKHIQTLVDAHAPAAPAIKGINAYNATSLASREDLDYDQVLKEYIQNRQALLKLLRDVPAEMISVQYAVPWGGEENLEEVVNIFGPHELEHAEDMQSLIAQAREQKR